MPRRIMLRSPVLGDRAWKPETEGAALSRLLCAAYGGVSVRLVLAVFPFAVSILARRHPIPGWRTALELRMASPDNTER